MANVLYPSFKQLLFGGDIQLDADTIKVALIKNTYVYNAAHDFYDDISAYVLGTPQTLGSKSIASGVFDAGDSTFTAVTGGNIVSALIIYRDTAGGPTTDDLIAFLDTGVGLPYTTNGGDITVSWSNGASKIFAI